MNVVLAYDGFAYSKMAINMVKALQLPSQTNITLLNVISEQTLSRECDINMAVRYVDGKKISRDEQNNRALVIIREAVSAIRAGGLKAEGEVLCGHTSDMIIKMAKDRKAQLLVMGAKGRNDNPSLKLGSTAAKLIARAPTNMLLVKKECKVLNRVLLAVDNSKYAEISTRLLLGLPLPKRCQVILLTALQSHVPALVTMPTLDLELNQRLVDGLRASEEDNECKTLMQMRSRFHDSGYKTAIDIMRGNTAESVLTAADRHNPDIVVVGARALNGLEFFFLGGVADKVARYSKASVLICR